MPDPAEPETSTGTDPDPMQTEENQTTFDKVMGALEDNDDMDTRQIMQQTGAADVKPEPTPEPESEEKPAEQDEEPEAKEKETEEKADEQDPDMDRFNKLAKRGREIGNRAHQLQEQETTLQQRHDDLEAREQAYQQNMQQFSDLMAAYERDPIDVYKLRGADPKVVGQRIKALLTDRGSVQASDQTSALEAKIDQLDQRITAQQEQTQQHQQAQAQAEAREAGHAEMKAYMSEESAQKAFPLTSKLPEAMFRQYSRGAVETLMKERLPLTHDSVLEVIESSLEELRPVYGDTPAQPPREAPASKAATPTGQRSAPSIGNADKTSGPTGPDWDTLSLGEDDDEFASKIRKEVASG